MSYEVFLRPRADKFLKKAEKSVKEQIIKKLDELGKNQNLGERLKYSAHLKLRIGDYRAIYDIDDIKKQIFVLYIGHRKNVYDDFSKLLI